jgi:H+/Cl- antiporter ClcA
LFIEAFSRETAQMAPLVVVTGVAGGIVGAIYVSLLHLLQRGLWPTHWSDTGTLIVLALTGVAITVLIKILGDPGDVELLVNNIHVLGGFDELKRLRSLIPVSLLGIAAGGALGPEAPLVQTTGSLGAYIGERRSLTRDECRVLAITGMAAGFTVLFGAPLGSAVFALEILHRRGLEYYEALLPAVVGSLCGYGVYIGITRAGIKPVWDFPDVTRLNGGDLGWAVLMGVAGALIAVAFTYLATGIRAVVRHLPRYILPALGGLAVGGLGFWSHFAPTFAETQLNPMVHQKAVVSVLAAAAIAKLLASATCLATGWRGGFIIPLFFIGAATGRLIHIAVPSTNEIVLVAALMAATNVGVTKTPIGSALVVSEMAGISMFPTTLIASVVALVLTSPVGLIETQRRRESATSDEVSDEPLRYDDDDLANTEPTETMEAEATAS